MPIILEETKSILEQLDTPEQWFLAHNLDTFSDHLFKTVKNAFPINGVPTYIEDELIGLKETLDLAAECYRKALREIIGFLKDDLEILESKKAKEAPMKNNEKKKVLSHLAEDTKEYKEAIKEDAKLKKVLKAPKPKKKK
jgi:hypothetical protein